MTVFNAAPLKGVARVLVVSIAMVGAPSLAAAQSAETPAAETQTEAQAPQDQTATMLQIIEANQAGGVDALTQALAPLIMEDPSQAATLIEIAAAKPDLAEILAEVLARIQLALRTVNPEKAKEIAALVASASPGFQAAYAVAQSDGGATGGAQVADAGGAAGGGTGGDGGGAGVGGVGYSGGIGGSVGGGGGTISPSAP